MVEPDVEIENPRPSQFVKQGQGKWRVSQESKHGTSCKSAFIVSIDPEGKFMTVTNGVKQWNIHPEQVSILRFFSKP